MGSTHAFEELGVCLPRLELNRRSDYNSALAKYLGTGGDTGNYLGDTGLATESCAQLQEAVHRAAYSMFPCAIADCSACVLAPGEEALVPAT